MHVCSVYFILLVYLFTVLSRTVLFAGCNNILAVIIFMLSLPDIVDKGIMLLACPVRSPVHSLVLSSCHILLPRYRMNGLNNFVKTDREYSLATTDDLIRFWRSKVKVTAGLSMWWRMHPCRCWDVQSSSCSGYLINYAHSIATFHCDSLFYCAMLVYAEDVFWYYGN